MKITLSFVGDVAFSGPLGNDPVGVAARIAPEVRAAMAADATIANLECPLTDDPPPAAYAMAMSAPTRTVEALKALGIGVVMLSNNHVLDAGPEGLRSTLSALDRAGILHFGAGMNYEEASRPLVLRRQGMRLGFLGFDGGQCATRKRPGTVPLFLGSSMRLIRRARAACDFLVVCFHGGLEALQYPVAKVVRDCHRAVASGADLIVGTHPHTIQGIEWYRGVPIAYSLGNFIIPITVPGHFEPWRKQAMLTLLGRPFAKDIIRPAIILRCQIAPGSDVSLEAVPLRLDDTGVPLPLKGEEEARDRRLLESLCEVFKHTEDPVWAMRDQIEREARRHLRKSFRWLDVLRQFHKIRWRHVVTVFRGQR